MKLSIVIPILNQHAMAHAVIDQLFKTIQPGTEVIVLDNGSKESFKDDRAIVVRFDKTIGVYPTFRDGFLFASGDVVAFFHSDLAVWEVGWDKRVLAQFEGNQRLGMVGFIGSNEIDPSGGRGLGTTSNFQGLTLLEGRSHGPDRGLPMKIGMWQGSHGRVHGKVSDGFSKAAVVDGCAMIIRREAWNQISYREDFPPHHFYDRLISTQLLDKNWKIGVLGIACDHFSGQTVNQEPAYHDMAQIWCLNHGFSGVGNPINWDATIYQEAERRWLKEYRDEKHIVPIKINA